jgi:hypothetical protein
MGIHNSDIQSHRVKTYQNNINNNQYSHNNINQKNQIQKGTINDLTLDMRFKYIQRFVQKELLSKLEKNINKFRFFQKNKINKKLISSDNISFLKLFNAKSRFKNKITSNLKIKDNNKLSLNKT